MRYLEQGTDNSLKYNLPAGGACCVGMPVRKRAICLTDGEVEIIGPPIEQYHPEEYSVLDYRADGTTMKYGIQMLYRITTGVEGDITNDILYVNNDGSRIFVSGAVLSGEEFIIYYYARVNRRGGSRVTAEVGQDFTPELADIPLSVWNESVPVNFGRHDSSTDEMDWVWKSRLIFRALNPAVNWNTLLDFPANGTLCDNFSLPIHVSNIRVYVEWHQYLATGMPDIPDDIRVRITVDGSFILLGYAGEDYIKFSRFDELHDDYTLDRAPGCLYDHNVANKPALLRSIKKLNSNYITYFDIPVGDLEILHDIKVELYLGVDSASGAGASITGYHPEVIP